MNWDYAVALYIQLHCPSRGLRSTTIAAYEATLKQFREYVRTKFQDLPPEGVSARMVLEYIQYLREVRENGDSAVNRQATVLKNFYRALVAMGHLEPAQNPLAHFPKIKAAPRKLPSNKRCKSPAAPAFRTRSRRFRSPVEPADRSI